MGLSQRSKSDLRRIARDPQGEGIWQGNRERAAEEARRELARRQFRAKQVEEARRSTMILAGFFLVAIILLAFSS